jgi:archaellum component FlaC
MSNPRIQMICEIQDALNASIIGIENLRETYADSTETVAYLEQQVKKIRSYMEKSGEFLLPMGIVTNIGATGSIDIERLMITHSPSG